MILDEILNTFENDDIRKFVEHCIENAPPYWKIVQASSSGKYHPQYALGESGLLRHTIAVVKFLNFMFEVESIATQFTSRERDLLRVSAIVHDMWKSGSQEEYEKSKWTRFDHPLIAANHILKMKGLLPDEELQRIATNVMSHMGAWNADKRHPDITLPKPQDKYQIILHLADYLASRKDIEMKFNNVEISAPDPESIPDINTWKFTFGKYSGKTIPEVAEVDPGYIKWAKDNMEKEPARTLLKGI